MSSAVWVVLMGLALASLPFFGGRQLFGVPVLKKAKTATVRVVEFFVCYLIWVGMARQFESVYGPIKAQSWEFFAVTLLFFIVVAYPAFVWRYLWRH